MMPTPFDDIGNASGTLLDVPANQLSIFSMTHQIVPCTPSDFDRILEVINRAAQAYRGVIPDECFHEPYMPAEELNREIAAGIEFLVCRDGDQLVGVMGLQGVADVTLIRHAYIDPEQQRSGIGAALLNHLRSQTDKPILIGTWKAATWAIEFYRKNGFALVKESAIRPLLQRYWTVPEEQIVNSCVLVEIRHLKRFASS